ncbi:MAG TPA: hypothetical protein VFO50_06290 [Candidatus Limnocylindrales bacterium]|nr:hypothetical protein [Candidatus Limnocylindrales bacterium]
MKVALARPFAVALALVTGLLLVAGILLWARSGYAPPPYVFMRGPLAMIAFAATVATQLASGYILAMRRPDLPVGRLALVFAAIVAGAFAAIGYLSAAEAGVALPWASAWIGWIPSWFAFGGATLTAIVLGLVIPDGRLLGRPWGASLGLAMAGAVLTSLALAFLPGPLILFPAYDNPAALVGPMEDRLAFAGIVGVSLLAQGAVASSFALLQRYRKADRAGRAQLRWYFASASVLSVGFLAFSLALAVLPPDSPLGEAILTAFIATCALPPVALLFAVSRHRLYDIDAILSRTFVFGTLTAILAGLYTASIRLFNSLFTAVTGESSDAALVLTTLVIAASFTPIKRRLEAIVERRFQGSGDATAPGSPDRTAGPIFDDATVERLAAALVDDPRFAAALDDRLRAAAIPERRAATSTGDTPIPG